MSTFLDIFTKLFFCLGVIYTQFLILYFYFPKKKKKAINKFKQNKYKKFYFYGNYLFILFKKASLSEQKIIC